MKSPEAIAQALASMTEFRRNPAGLALANPELGAQLPGVIAAFRYVLEDDDRSLSSLLAEVSSESASRGSGRGRRASA